MGITPRKIKQYGWRPDLPDYRDHIYGASKPITLPKNVDLRNQCPMTVYNQGALGSCTANAIGALYEFVQLKEKDPNVFTPSRLFIYYNEREIEGTISVDSGAQIRDGIKTVASLGVCPETNWPYDIKKFANKPPITAYSEALHHKAISYKRITQAVEQMKTCIAEGYPFVFGFTVFESFESSIMAKTGIMSMPVKDEKSFGGHAVMACAYDDDKVMLDGNKGAFLIRNSWGTNWGINGYFWMPYAYASHNYLASDFWTIRQTTDSNRPLPKPPKKSFWQKFKDIFFPAPKPLY